MKKQLLTVGQDKLWLGEDEFYLASGDFHYFRTFAEGWRHRLKLMKAFGLTAVQTYVPWNLHEPEKGSYSFDGRLNLRRFLEMCAEEGLYVLLRPSPYICSECDFGGMPYWLLNEDFCPRTSDEGFLAHYSEYFERLCREFVPLLSTAGGPVIAVALENEYGSFGMDREYLRWTEALYREAGIDVPLYTAGGPDMYKQIFGGFPDIWSGLDLRNGVESAIKSLRRFQRGFPTFISEFWGGCAQQWGGVFPRQKPETVKKNYSEALSAGAYVNFYMFCGGSNFGFSNGALKAVYRADVPGAKKRYIPFSTSYDVDAPVSEDGRPTEKYFVCREVLAETRGIPTSSLPELPEILPVQLPGDVEWKSSRRFFSALDTLSPKHIKSGNVRPMESLSQDYGFILYSAEITRTNPETSFILHIEGLHDRADIYIDGSFCGTYYRDRENEPVEFMIENESARLDILVENMGRINYGYSILGEKKGILECVHLDVKYPNGSLMYNYAIVTNYDIYSLPMKHEAVSAALAESASEKNGGLVEPWIFGGSFAAKPGRDAFLRFGKCSMKKGIVFVNGFNIGRYWAIGPQDTLYIPGELLKEENAIEVFELYSDGSFPNPDFCLSHELDSINTNAELILAPRA